MTPHNKARRWALAGFVLLILALVAGCSTVENLNYETTCDHAALADLEGGKLALIQFDASGLMMRAAAVDEEAAATVGEGHKAALIEALAPHFEIIDATDEAIVQDGDPPTLDDPERLQEIIDEMGVDGAILVVNGYGYELSQGGAILDEAAENVAQGELENIAGKEAGGLLQALTGPTFVTFYYLASETAIVDRGGELVWAFDGKASGKPRPLSGSASQEMETFARSFAGGDPTAGELDRALSHLHEPYSAYLSWVLDQELEESHAINYFVDYPGYEKKSPVGIYPASDASHVPVIMTEAERADYLERQRNNLWVVARSSRWNRLWQWRQAWASLKILGIALLVVIPLSLIMDKVQTNTDEPGCLQVVGFVASVAVLAAIYFLLRSVF